MVSVGENIERGKRLQQAREKAGFATAKEAADALGVEYPTYAGHENGSRGISRKVGLYSRRFGVSADWLLSGRGGGKDSSVVNLQSTRADSFNYDEETYNIVMAEAVKGGLFKTIQPDEAGNIIAAICRKVQRQQSANEKRTVASSYVQDAREDVESAEGAE